MDSRAHLSTVGLVMMIIIVIAIGITTGMAVFL